MPFQAGGAAGVTTLSDLEIDVDKDWKAHGIYNLGDLTPKVDGAYSLGESGTKFDTVYAGLMSDSVYKRNLRTGVVDTSYLTDNAATPAKVAPSVDLEFVRSNDNVVAGGITPKVDGAYNLANSTYQFNAVYSRNVTVGDIRMGNEWKITEHPEYGIALESPEGVIHKIELEEEDKGGD